MKRSALLITFLLVAFSVAAQTYYVRAGATGTGNGSDWTNAYTDLPSSMVRGATYYVAAGNYGVEDLKDPESGTALITIKKATASDHGTQTGWSASYASGVAHFQNFIFETGYYVINGQTGGGPGSWESGFGFQVYPNLVWTFPIKIRGTNWSAPPLPTHISLLHLDVQGKGYHAAPAPDGINAGVAVDPSTPGSGSDYLTIEYCYIHDTAGGQATIALYWANNIVFKYNEIARNYCTAAQHSEGMVLNADNQVTIAYNRFVDVEGSAIIAIGQEIPGTTINNNIDIYGNICYWTSSFAPTAFGLGMGFVGHDKGSNMPTYVITNSHIYNNTIVGITNNSMVYNSGLYIPDGTGNVAYNNLWVDCTAAALVVGNENYNTAIGSTTSYWAGANDIQDSTGDPFTSLSTDVFSLTGPTAPGATVASPFNVDMMGNSVDANGQWDRGALQYTVASATTTTPPAPSGLHVVVP